MSDQARSGKARKGGAIRFLIRHFLEAVALLMAIFVVVLTVLAWRLAHGPVPLNFARADFEAALARAFDGDVVALGGAQIEWVAQDRSLVLALTEVAVADEEGRLVAEAPRLEAGMRLSGLLRGEVEFSRLVAEGGAFSVIRRADGAIVAGLGRPDRAITRILRAGPSNASSEEELAPGEGDTLRDAFARMADAAGRLVELRVQDAELFFRDEITGIDWRATSTQVAVAEIDGLLDARASGLLSSGDEAAPLTMRVRAEPDLSGVLVELSVDRARPSSLFPEEGTLGALSGLDAEISIEGSVSYRRDEGVMAGDFAMEIGAGTLRRGAMQSELRGARLRLSYEPETAAVLIEELQFDAGESSGVIRGRIDRAGDLLVGAPIEEAPFEIAGGEIAVDARPFFENPLRASRFFVSGAITPQDQSLRLDAVELDTGGLQARVSGGVRLERVVDGRLLPAISLSGGAEGEASFRTVLDFWPVDLADGARVWVEEAVSAGQLSNARFEMNLPAEAFVMGRLPNNAMQLAFDFSEADVRIVSTMSPITDASGRGVLYGNSFALDMDEGVLRDLDLSEGRVRIPRLNPRGATATFSAVADGPARSILAFIDEPPLEYPTSYGVDPNALDGSGEVEVIIHRPMRTTVPTEDIMFTVNGRYSGVGGLEAVEGFALSGADIAIRATEAGLRAWGEGALGPLDADIEWREDFLTEDRSRSTRFHVRGSVEPAALDQLGVTARSILSGTAQIDVSTVGAGLDIDQARVEADLENAELRVPGLTWVKPEGEPATASFDIARRNDGAILIQNAEAHADGFDFAGDVAVREDGRLESLDIARLDVGGAIDLTATARRTERGLELGVNADYIDIRGVLPELIRSGSRSGGSGGGEDADANDADSPLSDIVLNAEISRALVTDEIVLENIDLIFETSGSRLRRFAFEGEESSGRISAAVTTGPGGSRSLRAEADDAGRALSAVLGYDGVEGGHLTIEGALPPIGADPGAPSDVLLTMENFRLSDAPALAQLLALGSFQGLADTLSGEGVTFSRLTAPVRVEGGRFEFDEARAAGSALGVTASGAIDFEARALDIDGVIVPVYAVNSLLGGVPLLGDWLVSRRGEGVIALTYSISGPFEETTIFVNPLAALAPGLLRRIFESTPIAEATSRDEAGGGER